MLLEHRDRQRPVHHLELSDVDLRGIDLSRLRAEGLTLRDADLREARLVDCRWRNCLLVDVRLDRGACQAGTFRLCKMERLRAPGASFTGTRIENTSAEGCLFDDADFASAVLTDSSFARCSLRNANLAGASAAGLDLRGADLRGAILTNMCLVDVDLRGALLSRATLAGADLRGADLRGAELDDTVEARCASSSETSEGPAGFPQELLPMLGAVAPVVRAVLARGEQGGLLDAEAAAMLRGALERWQASGVAQSRPMNEPELSQAVEAALARVASTGLAPLLQALRSETRSPPEAVANMLRGLAGDLKLGDDATVDDILQRLVARPRAR